LTGFVFPVCNFTEIAPDSRSRLADHLTALRRFVDLPRE
jgi:hypothetical protein